jgi:Tol biopolymer transport system component
LLFSSDHLDEGRSQVFEYDAEKGDVRKLTRGPVIHPEADYGPNDEMVFSWISFAANERRSGMNVRAIGGGEPKVVEEGVYPMGPRWSSAGDLILYVEADDPRGARDASAVVVRGLLAGGKVSRLARGRDAIFSSDGSWIIFSSQGPRGWRLQRMRPDGSGRKALGTSAVSARWPAISPDGRHVAYVSDEDGIDRLYLRRIDGSGDRILLEDGAVAFPVW